MFCSVVLVLVLLFSEFELSLTISRVAFSLTSKIRIQTRLICIKSNSCVENYPAIMSFKSWKLFTEREREREFNAERKLGLIFLHDAVSFVRSYLPVDWHIHIHLLLLLRLALFGSKTSTFSKCYLRFWKPNKSKKYGESRQKKEEWKRKRRISY